MVGKLEAGRGNGWIMGTVEASMERGEEEEDQWRQVGGRCGTLTNLLPETNFPVVLMMSQP